ncbi:MAG: hypothetical protein Q9174_006879 [Haloplaca sp. 1 TL-2023]
MVNSQTEMADDGSPAAAFETCLRDLSHISNAWDSLFDDERSHLVTPFTQAIDAMKAIFEIVPAGTLLQYLPYVTALRKEILRKNRANLLIYQINGLVAAFVYGIENPLEKPLGTEYNFAFAPAVVRDGEQAETRMVKAEADQNNQQQTTELTRGEPQTGKSAKQPVTTNSSGAGLSGGLKEESKALSSPWNELSDSESWASCSSNKSQSSGDSPKSAKSSLPPFPNSMRTVESTSNILPLRPLRSGYWIARYGTIESFVNADSDPGPRCNHENIQARHEDREERCSPDVQNPASEPAGDSGQRLMKELNKCGAAEPIKWFSTTGLPTEPRTTGIVEQKPLGTFPVIGHNNNSTGESGSKSQMDFPTKILPPDFSFVAQSVNKSQMDFPKKILPPGFSFVAQSAAKTGAYGTKENDPTTKVLSSATTIQLEELAYLL